LRGPQRKGTIILLLSPVLVATWWYFASPKFYLAHWAGLTPGGDTAAAAGFYALVAGFVLMGLIPALVVKLVFHEKLADYGVRLGDRVRTVRSFLILAPGLVLVAYLSSRDPATLAEYPVNKSAGSSPAMFGLHAVAYLVFYLGWEFHFRGFMQHGLRESMGDASAIWIQALASSLAHLGKPAAETYAALGVGVLWGVLAFRTRSLASGALQHALLGISLDWFICYG
jgi:uncharacterized protein